MRIKEYLIIFLVGILSFIILTPLRIWHSFLVDVTGISIITLVYSILCFFLIVFLLNKFQGKLCDWKIVMTFLVAILLPEIWIRSMHFMSTLFSLPDVLLRVISILFGWFYFRLHVKLYKQLLVIGVLLGIVWVSSYGMNTWIECTSDIVNRYSYSEINKVKFIDENKQNVDINGFRGKFLVLCFLKDTKEYKEKLLLINKIGQYANVNKEIVFSLVFPCDDSLNIDLFQQRDSTISYMFTSEPMLMEQSGIVIIDKAGEIRLRNAYGMSSEKIIELLNILAN